MRIALVSVGLLAALGLAQAQDLSPHAVRFIDVEDGVRLETLDWRGTGRPLVLLAGSGLSGHVFDEFAPKLKAFARVSHHPSDYGASSQPMGGYDDRRLAEDVVRVLDALRIAAPVLVGHSMAGGELTTWRRNIPAGSAGWFTLMH
jgi:pimeloyl-ACP methyl ester carboxylesterase